MGAELARSGLQSRAASLYEKLVDAQEDISFSRNGEPCAPGRNLCFS